MPVVENLDIHAGVSGVALLGHADADAVVSGRRKLELEPEDEIPVFLPRIEIAALAGDHAVLDAVVFHVAMPTVQILAAEQQREAVFGFSGRKDIQLGFGGNCQIHTNEQYAER